MSDHQNRTPPVASSKWDRTDPPDVVRIYPREGGGYGVAHDGPGRFQPGEYISVEAHRKMVEERRLGPCFSEDTIAMWVCSCGCGFGVTGIQQSEVPQWECANGWALNWEPVHMIRANIHQREMVAFDQLEAEVARLREALEKIADTDPDEGSAWFHDIARSALDDTTNE